MLVAGVLGSWGGGWVGQGFALGVRVRLYAMCAVHEWVGTRAGNPVCTLARAH